MGKCGVYLKVTFINVLVRSCSFSLKAAFIRINMVCKLVTTLINNIAKLHLYEGKLVSLNQVSNVTSCQLQWYLENKAVTKFVH